jgi:cellulose synthase/poly-beta-1,6-N-acetylglucosamine synthase-like glycosyltransferase
MVTLVEGVILILLLSSIFINITWIVFHFWRKERNYALKKYPSLSVIIPAHNEEKYIEKTIKGVLNTDYPGRREIIIINDGSTDGTGAILTRLRKSIPNLYVLRGNHTGKANGVNKASERANGDILIVIDADSVMDKNALREIVKPFSNPKIGAAAGIVRATLTRKIITWFQDFDYILTTNWRFIMDNIGGTYFLPGFVAFRRTAFIQLGGFQSDTVSEDADIALRLHKLGWGMAMTYATIHTQVPQSIRRLLKQRVRWARGAIQVMRKHSDVLFNKQYGSVGLYGLPVQIYWILYGLISTPISIFQIYQGYVMYFFSKGEYLSLNTLKYFLNWFSVAGIADYSYHVLSGAWEMTPLFPVIVASFLIGMLYNALALSRMKGFDVRHFLVWAFFMTYWLLLTPFIVSSILVELVYPMKRYKREVNVWEK